MDLASSELSLLFKNPEEFSLKVLSLVGQVVAYALCCFDRLESYKQVNVINRDGLVLQLPKVERKFMRMH